MEDSDEEWTPNSGTSHFMKNSIKKSSKKDPGISERIVVRPRSKSMHNISSSEHLYSFSKQLCRIEYPGLVKNITAAVDTVGGMQGIEMASGDQRIKLELHFHTNNKYNKPTSADRDTNPGILIKIKPTSVISQDNLGDPHFQKYSYEVMGLTSLSFKFIRLCDFQYLPLVTTYNDKVEYLYDRILPEKLPTLEWFLSCDTANQPKFFAPPSFARHGTSHNKLFLNSGEKFDPNIRPGLLKPFESLKYSKKSKKISTKHISIFVNLQNTNAQIPDQPLPYTMQLIKHKKLQGQYKIVKRLFEERPVWTKVAIQFKTGINSDIAKIIIPAVAYFCPIGPWRMAWIKYEYNPQKDFNARVYQTLDYRIRAKEGTKLKVGAKRSYTNKTSLIDRAESPTKSDIEERSFTLRPNYIPPARQMFYQYCDILLPEIQEMVSRLPKLPAGTKCDAKNGWLPVNFTEQCREIVNKYVMDRVQEELLEDTIKLQYQNQFEEPEKGEAKEGSSSTYCSEMLSNIKKGIYRNVDMPLLRKGRRSTDRNVSDSEVHTIDLSDEELDQINADDVVNTIPERLDENSDDEHLSQSSDLEIDMEAVEDVNKMIAGLHDEDTINVIS